eukprot:TRINITY_DN6020_c0_g1_i3.p1 TRINITY_DN6020_c0_g1~~TRINITY_DN6020_c0_g1_i3.p1  ORF type:complete len:710 (-),score=138.37 TRINITY_DN6020_c0_g1_i3:140-2269(-)
MAGCSRESLLFMAMAAQRRRKAKELGIPLDQMPPVEVDGMPLRPLVAEQTTVVSGLWAGAPAEAQASSSKQPARRQGGSEGPKIDLAEVLRQTPEEKVQWLQLALANVASGKIKPNKIYDVVANAKFSKGVDATERHKMHKMLLAKLDLFTLKQQRFLQSDNNTLNVSDREAEESTWEVPPQQPPPPQPPQPAQPPPPQPDFPSMLFQNQAPTRNPEPPETRGSDAGSGVGKVSFALSSEATKSTTVDSKRVQAAASNAVRTALANFSNATVQRITSQPSAPATAGKTTPGDLQLKSQKDDSPKEAAKASPPRSPARPLRSQPRRCSRSRSRSRSRAASDHRKREEDTAGTANAPPRRRRRRTHCLGREEEGEADKGQESNSRRDIDSKRDDGNSRLSPGPGSRRPVVASSRRHFAAPARKRRGTSSDSESQEADHRDMGGSICKKTGRWRSHSGARKVVRTASRSRSAPLRRKQSPARRSPARRSPVRQSSAMLDSRSPTRSVRRQSPMRQDSRSPMRRPSPPRRRSPVRRQSPTRRRSPLVSRSPASSTPSYKKRRPSPKRKERANRFGSEAEKGGSGSSSAADAVPQQRFSAAGPLSGPMSGQVGTTAAQRNAAASGFMASKTQPKSMPSDLRPTGVSSGCDQAKLLQSQLEAARRLQHVPMSKEELRPGDWLCPVCTAHNFKSKSVCFRCAKGRNPAILTAASSR